jgi:peptidoglycan/LPS O-acetylase OafA/YrhL
MIYRGATAGWSTSSKLYVGKSIAIYFMGGRLHGLLTNGVPTGIDWINSAVALAIFLVALKSKMAWRWIKPLRWIGDISYPLYLIHVPLGWMLLVLLAKFGLRVHAAGALTML